MSTNVNTKKKAVRYITAKGIAQYPWVFEPDTKFDADGQFHIQLIVPKEDAKEMIKRLSDMLDEFKAKTEKEKGKKVGKMDFFDETPEGDSVQFKFKQKHVLRRKDGSSVEVHIPVFDSRGGCVTAESKMGTGSTVKVCYSPLPYYNAVTKSVGLSLRLVAVQVLALVQYSAGAAEGFGFSTDSDGYVNDSKVKNEDEDGEDDEDTESESDDDSIAGDY